jgi:very-short-patch-repair endonuclease
MGNEKDFQKDRNQLIEQARKFRKKPTKSEAVLWKELRNRKLGGFKFKRQRVFGPFILDFYCPSCKLAIELDGEIHQSQQEYDSERTKKLADYGLTVIRFKNQEVISETENVLKEILDVCQQIIENAESL